MPPRRGKSRNFPLEWKTDVISVTDNTAVNGEFDLDLLPDEIAEIFGISSHMENVNVPDAANIIADLYMYLSMDPDANDTPSTLTNLEDLEVFFSHQHAVQLEIGAAGASSLVLGSTKEMWLPESYPILIGTNFAQMVVAGNTAVDAFFVTTVYFKRRRATQSDLNQILLKRR